MNTLTSDMRNFREAVKALRSLADLQGISQLSRIRHLGPSEQWTGEDSHGKTFILVGHHVDILAGDLVAREADHQTLWVQHGATYESALAAFHATLKARRDAVQTGNMRRLAVHSLSFKEFGGRPSNTSS